MCHICGSTAADAAATAGCHSQGVSRNDDERDHPAPAGPAEPAEVDAEIVDERARDSEPPIVARLVVEIRSDGRTTIARGAMEDAGSGRGVAIEASGRSPLQLALSLARSLVTLPVFGRKARALLRGRDGGRGGNR
jgi:hypothetical protein